MSMPPLLQVGTQYETWEPAGEIDIPGKGTARQVFASGAFDRSVGKVIPLKIEGRTVGRVRVVAAEVAPDGSGVTLTYEVVEVTR